MQGVCRMILTSLTQKSNFGAFFSYLAAGRNILYKTGIQYDDVIPKKIKKHNYNLYTDVSKMLK